MTSITDKIAATKNETTKTEAKEKAVYKSFSRSGFQFMDGFIRPNALKVITPKDEKEEAYINDVLIPEGKVYVEKTEKQEVGE